VYAFDIQQAALDSTAKRLGELNSRVSLILDSHENVDQYVNNEIGGAMFNLGYLPHGEDLSIVTKPDSTIDALHKLLNLLKVGGIVSIAVYDGHEGGADERDTLLNFVQSLHQADFQVIKYQQLNRINNPPFLIVIEKMRGLSQ
ncbi:class I SAM-dependent methyltransferase, partial [Microvirga sp. 3-52]|nr:class I SAM-dependent methyltransferase [Microvirga sp. 3-52]